MRNTTLIKRATFILVLLILIFISGCVRIETYEKFYPNGRSGVVSQVYISNLVNTLNISGLSPPQGDSWAEYFEIECTRIQKSPGQSKCHISEDWLIFHDTRVSGNEFVLTSYDAFPYTIYELTILVAPLPPLGEFRNVGDFDLPKNLAFSKFNDSAHQQLSSSGLAYNYLISVPGEVIETSHGSSSYNAVSFNVLEVIESKRPIRIKARELNFWKLFFVIVGGIILFLVLDFAIIWFLKEWSARKKVGDAIRKKRQLDEDQKRAFRKDGRLKGNQVYRADKSEDSS